MAIFRPIELAVAWIMVQFHNLLTWLGLDPASGVTWALSIVGLVLVIRTLLIPLFVKQIRAQRGMQMLQPEMKKIQDKYKGRKDPASRQAMQQEQMALYRSTGTNPFSSCLPLLLQMPIFFSLFRVLTGLPDIADGKTTMGVLTAELAGQARESTVFGAPLSATFLGSDEITVKLVTVILIIGMSVATFLSSRQALMKNMPTNALDNPMARQQKIMMYALPGIFAITGVNFPIGVLLYWLTTNIWSMGQQFFIIKRMPAPGTAAAKELNERRAKRGLPPVGSDKPATETGPAPTQTGQRQQPVRKDRQRKQRGGPAARPQSAAKPGGGKSVPPRPTSSKAAPPRPAGKKAGPGGKKGGPGGKSDPKNPGGGKSQKSGSDDKQ